MSEETKNTEEQVVATEVQETATPAVETKKDPKQFLADFNWHKYEQGIDEVDEEKLKEFEEALKGTIGFVNESDVIEGTVVRITDRDAIIDINSKSEGVISLNEFRYNQGLKEGDVVEVLVDKREDSSGQLVLSHRKARVIKA